MEKAGAQYGITECFGTTRGLRRECPRYVADASCGDNVPTRKPRVEKAGVEAVSSSDGIDWRDWNSGNVCTVAKLMDFCAIGPALYDDGMSVGGDGLESLIKIARVRDAA